MKKHLTAISSKHEKNTNIRTKHKHTPFVLRNFVKRSYFGAVVFANCLLLTLFGATNCFSQNLNITLVGQLSYGAEELSNIWGWKSPVDGKEYALVGADSGLSIVDVSIPSTPVVIKRIYGPFSTWREVRTNGNYAYVTTESGTIGLQIVDLTNLPATNLAVATWTPTINTQVLETIHALQIDNGKVYLYGSNVGGGGAVVADINTNPMAPIYLGSYDAGGYIHDGYVRNDTLYAGHILAGMVAIVDMTNPASGVLLASFQTPHNFTHNTWLSQNSKYCFTTDEVDDAYLAAFDISNFGNITVTDTIQSNPGSNSSPHNTYIINKFGIDYAVTSWYKDGLTVVDCSNPSNLIQVGNYDTSPAMSGGGYGGCWGVYPFLPSGLILASDIENGLYILNSSHLTFAVNQPAAGNLQVNVYPNPSNGKFNVQMPESSNVPVAIQVYNIYGECIHQPSTINHQPLTIDISSHPRGIYFIKVSTGQGVATKKIILQ